MNKKLIFINERVSVEDTRFLLTINKEARELYILHREYPRCLVYVEQSTPINFIVLDLFENNSEQRTVFKYSYPYFRCVGSRSNYFPDVCFRR